MADDNTIDPLNPITRHFIERDPLAQSRMQNFIERNQAGKSVQRWTDIYLNSKNPAMRREAYNALQSLERRENINRQMLERAAEKEKEREQEERQNAYANKIRELVQGQLRSTLNIDDPNLTAAEVVQAIKAGKSGEAELIERSLTNNPEIRYPAFDPQIRSETSTGEPVTTSNAPVESVTTSPPNVKTAITDGQNIQARNAQKELLVDSLLNPSSQAPTASTGWDRLFKIMSRMGATGGVSPVQDFIRGNIALSNQEAAAAQNYQERMIKERDLAERRADRDERLRLEKERLELAKEGAALRGLESQYIGRTKTDQDNVTAQILSYIQAVNLSEYADKLDGTWIERRVGMGLSNEEIAEGLTLSVIEIYNRAIANNTPITIEQAIEQAATKPGDESSGNASGIRSDSPVKINPAAPIESK
jgi:hypothetical protein